MNYRFDGDRILLTFDRGDLINKTFEDFSVDKDPANNCLDTAIITDPKLRTKKTIKKLEHIAGRALKK